ncbi:MAG: YeeE/YedE family protein [Rubrobacter sp.]
MTRRDLSENRTRNWREKILEDFTPLSGLVGGLLIGLSTAMLMLLNGRIAGISGIVGGLLARKGPEVGWRAMFAAGLLLGALAYVLVTGGTFPVRVEAGLPVMVAAGLLVGFGTRLGSGCTSGHGVAGIARLSRRSIVATLMFMGAAILTVFVSGRVI